MVSTIPDMEIGTKYPVALPGGRVGQLEIEEREYETFTSQGKFCCSTELGLTKLEFVEHEDGTVDWKDGLMDPEGRALSIFPDCEDLEIGTDLALTDRRGPVDPFVHRIIGVEPLGVLLVAIKDKRVADETFADQLEHVLHGRRVAKGQAHLGLQAFGIGQPLCTPHVAVIVTHGLFHEAMLARLQRGKDHVLVIATGHDIHNIDVATL